MLKTCFLWFHILLVFIKRVKRNDIIDIDNYSRASTAGTVESHPPYNLLFTSTIN